MRIAIGITIALTGCVTTRIAAPPAERAPRLDERSEAAVAFAVVDCAPQYGVTGDVRVRLDIDDDGGIGGLRTDRDDDAFAKCAGAELTAVRFPRGERGRPLVLVVRAR